MVVPCILTQKFAPQTTGSLQMSRPWGWCEIWIMLTHTTSWLQEIKLHINQDLGEKSNSTLSLSAISNSWWNCFVASNKKFIFMILRLVDVNEKWTEYYVSAFFRRQHDGTGTSDWCVSTKFCEQKKSSHKFQNNGPMNIQMFLQNFWNCHFRMTKKNVF